MEILKLIILMAIFIISSTIGMLISRKYQDRVLELKEIKNALNMLKTKIKFTYEPLPDIFCELALNLNENVGKIFYKASNKMKQTTAKDAWNSAIDEAILNINNEDINILKGLGKMLRKNRCRRTN